ncbi:hemolysin, partial [Moraxella catarrhalis]|nr:hemolysin [Moraxella catarrhalis]
GKGEIGQPREMQKSTDPNKAADDFAQQFLGRKPTADDYKQGAAMNNNNCQGCWRAQTPDGTWVIYRPAGKAGKDTLPTTATVEVNSKNIKGANKNAQLKLKFPKE